MGGRNYASVRQVHADWMSCALNICKQINIIELDEVSSRAGVGVGSIASFIRRVVIVNNVVIT